MFSFTSLSVLALATASVVSGLAIPRAPGAPSTWSSALEDYTTYHLRYLSIDCQDKHDTAFFDSCCHPLMKGAQPDPSCTSGSNTPDDEEECDDGSEDDNDNNNTPPPPPPAPTHTSTSKPAPAPKPTPTPKPAPASPPANAPKPPNNASSGSSGLVTGGFATFFFQNGVAGACGTVHGDGDLIAAIDSRRYGNTGVKSSLCGKRVQITNPKNNKSVTVTIADACPTCANSNSIDLSVGAFTQIATKEEGMVGINWKFV